MITLEVTVRDKNNSNSKRLKLKKKKHTHTERNDNLAISGFEFSTKARVQPLGQGMLVIAKGLLPASCGF